MLYRNKKNRSNNRKYVIAALVLLLVMGGGLYLLIAKRSTSSNIAQVDNTPQPEVNQLNLDPPSEEEKQSGDEIKDRLAAEQAQNTTNQNGQGIKSVSPVITYAGLYGENVEVGGFVNGTIENGGTCTAIFKKNGVEVSSSSSGIADASSTSCPAIIIPKSKFSSGSWQLVLVYSSGTSSGTSTSKQVELNL